MTARLQPAAVRRGQRTEKRGDAVRNAAIRFGSFVALSSSFASCADVEMPDDAPPVEEAALQTGADALPSPQDIQFTGVKYAGFGCSKSNTLTKLNEQRTVMSVYYSGFAVRVDPPQSLEITGCRLTVGLKVPDGWSVAVVRYVYDLLTLLPKGTRGTLDVEFGYDEPGAGTEETHFDLAPSASNLEQSVFVDVSAPHFSSCGGDRSIVVGMDLGVFNNDALSEVASARMLSSSGNVGGAIVAQPLVQPVKVELKWKRCR